MILQIFGLVVWTAVVHASANCGEKLNDRLIDVDQLKTIMSRNRSVSSAASELEYYRGRVKERTMDLERMRERIAQNDIMSDLYRREIPFAEAVLARLKEFITESEAEIEKLSSAPSRSRAELVREAVLAKTNQDSGLRAHVLDYLQQAVILKLPRDKMVTVLLPHREDSHTVYAHAIDLVRRLLNLGYFVVLDGLSPMSSDAASLVGENVLIVDWSPDPSEVKQDVKRRVTFANIHFYLEALRQSRHVISVSNSPISLALQVDGEIDGAFDPDRKMDEFDLETWSKSLRDQGLDLFLPKYSKQKIYVDGPAIIEKLRLSSIFKSIQFKPRKIEKSDPEELVEAAEYANRMMTGLSMAEGPAAVVFGSGRMVREFSPLIYDVAHFLGRFGLGVATGGSGGAMLAANLGAFDSGGQSIGIPLVGPRAPITEKRTFSDLHTVTISAENYDQRLPWLLHDRKVIVVSPGGSGTMREIVTSFAAMSKDKNLVMIFLSQKYYGGFISELRKQSIDPGFLARISVVDNVDEFQAELMNYGVLGTIDLSSYGTRIMTPRSTRNALPEAYLEPEKVQGQYEHDSIWSDGIWD